MPTARADYRPQFRLIEKNLRIVCKRTAPGLPVSEKKQGQQASLTATIQRQVYSRGIQREARGIEAGTQAFIESFIVW
jgi:hypothetical protein